jgi:hypothetical protein
MIRGIFGFQILVVVLIIAGIFFSISRYNNKQTVKTKVTDKERITTSGSDGKVESYYLIFTDAGTFKLEDDLIYGNFNSSDWYGRIKRDSTYTFDLIGYRIGYMSEYPNIVNFKEN